MGRTVEGKDGVDEGASGAFAFGAGNMDDVQIIEFSDFVTGST